MNKQTTKQSKQSKNIKADKAIKASKALKKELDSAPAPAPIPAAKAAPAAAKAARVPMKPAKKPSIQDYACELLTKEADVNKVLEAVKKQFPEAKTSIKCIYWYRSAMNKGRI